MHSRVLLHRLAWLGLALAALVAVFQLVARPWYLSWGATEEERGRSLPGDEIVPGGHRQTRAITVEAPAREVWSWVAQLGQDRGGFYSFELLEDLAGCEMTNLDQNFPALQVWKLGDKLWMYPPEKLGGVGHAVLRVYEPGRALGFGTRMVGTPLDAPENGSWSFVVEQAGENRSRLLVRGAGGERGLWATLFDRFVFEPMHFTMERKMMTEIKARAEGRGPTPIQDNLEVVSWLLCFGAFVGAGFKSLRSGTSGKRWLVVVVGAGLLLQFLPFVQPPLLLGAALLFALMAVWLWASKVPCVRPSPALFPARAAGR
jgi:hypothetical protein